jgi:GxxExxY protein
MDENEIGTMIVGAAVHIHRVLGPGLLESVYEAVLAYELQMRGLHVERQVPVAITYGDVTFAEAFRADLVVVRSVIVELKCVESLTNAHKKQLLTYLRLSGCRLGYLLNFSEAVMTRGITRTVNGLADAT